MSLLRNNNFTDEIFIILGQFMNNALSLSVGGLPLQY